ncbi:MAG: TetR/AcrR family transcriptional repressor of nem operon [Bacteriovoracaceae bacterium]|jgi:TetR/AcrR family transcriptional repressor of nem operon
MSRTVDFDEEVILEKAVQIFWNKGYDGTSLKDLIEGTGLLKGSLYNTFKSKENLFLLCLDKYGSYSKSFFYTNGDPKEYIKKFFTRLVREGAKKENTKGCLIMNSCLEFAEQDNAPAKKTKALFSAVELNFENVAKLLVNNPKKDHLKLKTSLVTAAFSIREISKFKKDKQFLKQIANNALKEIDLAI